MRIKMLNSKKAQNLTELALLIGLIAIVFISMDVYFRRSLQSKIKFMTDKYMTGNALNASSQLARNQEAYSVDTHDYVVLNSTTPTQSGTLLEVSTYSGGSRRETTTQHTDIGTLADPVVSHSEIQY